MNIFVTPCKVLAEIVTLWLFTKAKMNVSLETKISHYKIFKLFLVATKPMQGMEEA
jgi:hypothetical protein